MANIFFDTNYFIKLYSRKKDYSIDLKLLEDNDLFVSTLTYHIVAYTQKVKIPNQEFTDTTKAFNLVDYTGGLLANSLEGPTEDLEDNIQLHSATKSNCDYFLTFDKKLLKMKFFGKMRIVATI